MTDRTTYSLVFPEQRREMNNNSSYMHLHVLCIGYGKDAKERERERGIEKERDSLSCLACTLYLMFNHL